MKRVLFNFFVLQIIVWAIVFYDDSNDTDQINYASISDTWKVVKAGDQNQESFVLHYPSFQKLTLNENGSFIRVQSDERIEKGNWYLDDMKSKLTLIHEKGIKEYDIIQLPVENSQSFIIKESIADASSSMDIEYELNRL